MRIFRKREKSHRVNAVWKSNALCELVLKHTALLQGD